jgi:two-component system, chemotaxis family, sensor kinase Cph1
VEFAVVDLGEGRFAPEIETALYRVVQKALTSIARHAQATCVGVVVERRAETLVVIVEDNGRGLYVDLALDSGRLGLLGMRERAEMLGGSLAIESSPGAGCSVYATVPLA